LSRFQPNERKHSRSEAYPFITLSFRPDLYSHFIKRDGVFIALPEKAILDTFYLASLGRYSLDGSCLDFTAANSKTLAEISGLYPPKARKYFEEMLLFK